jgi:hypothetical protein
LAGGFWIWRNVFSQHRALGADGSGRFGHGPGIQGDETTTFGAEPADGSKENKVNIFPDPLAGSEANLALKGRAIKVAA